MKIKKNYLRHFIKTIYVILLKNYLYHSIKTIYVIL